MIEELVARVFAARNASHAEHWKTKSYAEHVALGGFYDAVVEQIDAVVEAYQGNFALLGKVDLTDPEPNGSILQRLERDAAWIDSNRSKIAGGVRAIENLVDALTETYLTTIYKLKHLS